MLARALQSVCAQTRLPNEVLVIDDGSTDNTAARIRTDFPDVELIRQENRGVSAARNAGIRRAKGTWIALLDSDDAWLPEKLERQLEALERAPDTVLCHTDEIWIRRGRRVNPMKKHRKYGGAIFERCLPLCVISPSSALVHRRLFELVGLFDESLPACEDYDFWLRATARFPVLYVEQALTMKYGGHADQLSHRFWGMDRFRIAALEKLLEDAALEDAKRRAVQATLARKIAIYAAGARKRGRESEARRYEERLAR